MTDHPTALGARARRDGREPEIETNPVILVLAEIAVALAEREAEQRAKLRLVGQEEDAA